jgi:hypothetical protein
VIQVLLEIEEWNNTPWVQLFIISNIDLEFK